MSDSIAKLIIFAAVSGFLVSCIFWTKPVSDSGKLSLKLSAVNASGWLLILLLQLWAGGHPPIWLFPAILFWLINLPLLPATAVSLWMCGKSREERGPYLAIAAAYILGNVGVLFILPLVWVLRS